MSVRLVALLWSCASEADLYREALAKPSWAEAQRACARLATVRDRCLMESMDRLDRRDSGDCAMVSVNVQDECRFLYAEREARAGNAPEAMRACATTRFARECSYHLVREAARTVLSQPPGAAESALRPWLSMPTAPDSARLFWKAYFREQLAAKMTANPGECPNDVCRQGAQETLYASLNAAARADPAALCLAVPEVPRGWIIDELTSGWVEYWIVSECRARGMAPPAIAAAP